MFISRSLGTQRAATSTAPWMNRPLTTASQPRSASAMRPTLASVHAAVVALRGTGSQKSAGLTYRTCGSNAVQRYKVSSDGSWLRVATSSSTHLECDSALLCHREHRRPLLRVLVADDAHDDRHRRTVVTRELERHTGTFF